MQRCSTPASTSGRGCAAAATPTRAAAAASAAAPRLLRRNLISCRGWSGRGGGSVPPPPGGPGGGPPIGVDPELDRARATGGYAAPPPRTSAPPPPPGGPGGAPPPPRGDGGGGGLSGYAKALVAAAFVTGLGAGVYFDAEINVSPNQVASTEIIDRRTPNSEVCMAYGYSAMVFDQRVFVTYNPFNLYVTQPEVKPGCVLRRSNFNVLERDKLVTNKQVEQCKKRMNTFGFVGDLSGDPEVSCVYHSEEAENQYLLGNDGKDGPIPRPPLPAAAGGKPGGAAAE